MKLPHYKQRALVWPHTYGPAFWAAVMSRKAPWFWLILGTGAALRLVSLGRQSLWLDEAISYWVVNRPWPELVEILGQHPRPLHYIVLHLMVALGGSEELLRLPSALAGIASIGLIYLLGKELFDRNTGLLSAVIVAFSPLHIWYSQEARMYALLAILGLAAGLFAVRAIRANRPADWILFGILEGLALWTETGAIWLVIAFNFAGFLMLRTLWRSNRFWSWGAAQAIALLVYMPVLIDLFHALEGDNTLWIPPATFLLLARTLADFTGSFMRTPIESRIAILLFFIGFAGCGKRLLQEALTPGGRKWGIYLLLACWGLVPIGLSFLLSQRYVEIPFISFIFPTPRSVFLTRNLILATFPLYLLMARGLVLARPPFGGIILSALLLFNTYAYLGNVVPERKENFREAAEIVKSREQAGDLVTFSPPFLETPFIYYYSDQSTGFPLRGVERSAIEDGVIAEDHERIYGAPVESVPGHQRVWLISNDNPFQPDSKGTVEALSNWGQVVETWEFAGLKVQLITAKQKAP